MIVRLRNEEQRREVLGKKKSLKKKEKENKRGLDVEREKDEMDCRK